MLMSFAMGCIVGGVVVAIIAVALWVVNSIPDFDMDIDLGSGGKW